MRTPHGRLLRSLTAVLVMLGGLTVTATVTATTASACMIDDYGHCVSTLPYSKVLGNNQIQGQHTSYYCGPAATRIALSVRGYLPSQETLAWGPDLQTETNGHQTESAAYVANALNHNANTGWYEAKWGYNYSSQGWADLLKSDITFDVSRGFALVVNVVNGASTDEGWLSYPSGHYLTVLGYDQAGNRALIADTGHGDGHQDGNGYYYSVYWMDTSALAAWSHNRGYAA